MLRNFYCILRVVSEKTLRMGQDFSQYLSLFSVYCSFSTGMHAKQQKEVSVSELYCFTHRFMMVGGNMLIL